MKRLIALILALSFLICFAGCNKDDEDAPSSSTKTKSVMPVTEAGDESSTEKTGSTGTGSYVSGNNNQQASSNKTQQSQQQASSQKSNQQASSQKQQQAQQQQQSQQQTQQATQPQGQQQQSSPVNIDVNEILDNSGNVVADLIPDQDVIEALMASGGSIAGGVMVTVYNNMTPERQAKVKEALATATDSAGNVDISQFSSLISSLFKK